MLGQFNAKQLYSWLADSNGERSKCLNAIYDDIDAWRQNYWDCLIERYCRKTKHWEHENEYRLLLIGSFFDYSDKESRKLKYSFSDLRGIVLGSHMSHEHQDELLDIVRAKCEQEGRKDFEVYVLETDSMAGTIRKRPINKCQFTNSEQRG